MASFSSPQSSPGPVPARGPIAGGRVGLSEYTTQRLAELRARRAADAEVEQSPVRSSSTRTTSSGAAITAPSQPPPPPPVSSTPDSPSRSFSSSADTAAAVTASPKSVINPAALVTGRGPSTVSTMADPANSGISRTPSSTESSTSSPSTAAAAAAARRTQVPAGRVIQQQQQPDESVSSSSSFSATSSTVNPSATSRPSYQPPPPSHQHSVSVDGSSSAMTSSLISNGSPSTANSSGRSLMQSGTTSGPSAGNHLNHQLTSSTYSNGRCSPSVFGGRAMTGSKQGDDDEDCLGFASLPDQVHRKAVKRGFDFTVMVVGESGLGKSTLLSCLFLNNDLYSERHVPSAEERIAKTVEIERKYMEIEEKGVKLRLTVVDTPGFNDSLSAVDSWKSIRDYIDNQYDQYYNDETGLNRKNIKDNRVHCCLYFISPYGHGLRQIDVELMRSLQDRVNIVPVIAKSDTLTPMEIRRLKTRILEEIEKYKIRIYEFPDCDSDEDEEFKRQDNELKAAIPFAVMASNTVVEVNGRKIRGRLYPWGIVEVDNPNHSDFSRLRQFIISTHMQDLKDVTRDVHYENYRARHIQEQMVQVSQKERNKLKRDSGINFDVQLDTERLLQQKEHEIQQMKEMLKAMHAQLAVKGNNGVAGRTVNGVGH